MFDVKDLKISFKKNLDLILNHQIITSISMTDMHTPCAKLGIFLTTSNLKIHLLGEELLSLIEENRFFIAIGYITDDV